MAIDTSFYGNLQPYQAPSLMDSQQKAMNLSQMAMQNQGMQMQQVMQQRQMMVQQATRQAYASSLDPNGNLDQKSYLSQLAQIDPNASFAMQEQMGKADEATAKAGTANNELYGHRGNIVATGLDFIKRLPADQQEDAYNNLRDSWLAAKVSEPGQLPDFTPSGLDDLHMKGIQHMGMSSKDYLSNQDTKAGIASKQASTAKTYAEIGDVGDKRVQALKDDLDPNKARGGNMAKAQGIVNAADRLEAVYKQFPDGNIPKNQGAEVATAYAALLQGGSPAVEQIKSVVPSSVAGDANSLASWFTNNPMGTDQQKFYSLLHESIQRERQVADTQVKTAQVQRLSGHRLLQQTNPEAVASLLSSYGINPESIVNGKYVPADEQGVSAGGTPQVTSLGNVLGGKKRDDGNAYAAGQKATVTPGDSAAMQWLNDPKTDKSSPEYFSVKAKLKGKGLMK